MIEVLREERVTDVLREERVIDVLREEVLRRAIEVLREE